eukprot:25459-Chlamydomonas_euryale.AAC.4
MGWPADPWPVWLCCMSSEGRMLPGCLAVGRLRPAGLHRPRGMLGCLACLFGKACCLPRSIPLVAQHEDAWISCAMERGRKSFACVGCGGASARGLVDIHTSERPKILQ